LREGGEEQPPSAGLDKKHQSCHRVPTTFPYSTPSKYLKQIFTEELERT